MIQNVNNVLIIFYLYRYAVTNPVSIVNRRTTPDLMYFDPCTRTADAIRGSMSAEDCRRPEIMRTGPPGGSRITLYNNNWQAFLCKCDEELCVCHYIGEF